MFLSDFRHAVLALCSCAAACVLLNDCPFVASPCLAESGTNGHRPRVHVIRYDGQAFPLLVPTEFANDSEGYKIHTFIESVEGVEYFGQELRDTKNKPWVKIGVSRMVVDGKFSVITICDRAIELQIHAYGVKSPSLDEQGNGAVKKIELEKGMQQSRYSLKD